MGLTSFAVGKTLDNMFATQGQTISSSSYSVFDTMWGRYVYLGLFNGDPSSQSSIEVNGAGYKRILIGAHINDSYSSPMIPFICAFCETGKFDANSIENVNAISFDYAEANWGTVTHFGIFGSNSDDPTDVSSQNLILSGEFTTPVTINQGHIATFKKRSGTASGAFKITME